MPPETRPRLGAVAPFARACYMLYDNMAYGTHGICYMLYGMWYMLYGIWYMLHVIRHMVMMMNTGSQAPDPGVTVFVMVLMVACPLA